jgi:erythromycin esterase-like protein
MADLDNNIDCLKRCHAEMMKELGQIDQDLAAEEQKLADLPSTITTMRQQKDSIAQQAQILREQEQTILGSADANRQEIDVEDQLRLDLTNAIHLLAIV